MRYRFATPDGGFVGVALDDDLPVLADALDDSLGTRPPRGAPQDGPSTYWLDNAITRLRERMESGNTEPFASGNVTYLNCKGGESRRGTTTTRWWTARSSMRCQQMTS